MTKRNVRRALIGSLVVVLAWALFAAIVTVLLDRGDRDDKGCPTDVFTAPGSVDVLDLGVTEAALELNFDQRRGATRDEARINVDVEPPTPLEVSATSLTGSGGTIDAEDVHVRAQALRDTILLKACLDLRAAGGVGPGDYSGLVIFTDRRVSSLSVPLTVTVQDRRLWAVAPLILLFPLVGIAISSQLKANRVTYLALITGIGAVATAFAAQGLNNPSWGGIWALFALVATMYTAGVGAVATVNAPGDNEKKVAESEP